MLDKFDFKKVTKADREIAHQYIGSLLTPPDLIIAPDGKPYIYRWHIVRDSELASIYFHIQVADDPERPLHDHPWDNMSVILSGGYTELLKCNPRTDPIQRIERNKGDVVFRKASWAHRLLLKSETGYTMSQFVTGPKVREWGFWYPSGWRSFKDVTHIDHGKSVMNKEDRNHD